MWVILTNMPLGALNVPLQLDQGFFGSWPRRTESDEIFVSNFKSIQVHAFYRQRVVPEVIKGLDHLERMVSMELGKEALEPGK